LLEAGRPAEAEAAYRQALVLNPNYFDAQFNLGNLLHKLNRMTDAEVAYRSALKLRPDSADAQYSLGFLLLATGRFADAWPYHAYCANPDLKNFSNKVSTLPYPQWRGEPLDGKSLLIWPEQGFGDYIQFIRYVPLLKQRGAARITVVCAAPLHALLATVDGVDQVRSDLPVEHTPDYWTFPLGLPLFYGTVPDTIPATVPYLQALPERMQQWRDRLPTGGFKVGLVWKGNPQHGNDFARSLPGLSTLAPLCQVPVVRFVSLQKGQGEDEAMHAPADQALIALGKDIADFADSAAIVAQLDLVICVDTAAAHIAGALNIPCWVLLPAFGTDWRWFLERSDSPWYPCMRLFRQTTHGNWEETVADLVAALRQQVAAVLPEASDKR